MQAVIQAKELDQIGIAVDFKKLKKELDSILDVFDHTNISEHDAFKDINPTSEIIAKVIFELLSAKMNDGNVAVIRIRVCESPGSGATYYVD